jgi:hypothetical protein
MKKKILVLSDSHGRTLKMIKSFFIKQKEVAGSSINGLKNQNSKTKALINFRSFLEKSNGFDYCLLMLGEVDANIVIWNKSKRDCVPVSEVLLNTINIYSNFIEQEVFNYYKPSQVIIAGANLPSVSDDLALIQNSVPRRSIKATQKERTELTLRLNNSFKDLAALKGCRYIDITDNTIDSNTGLLNDEFLRHDGRDHHLPTKKTYMFWEQKLLEEIN